MTTLVNNSRRRNALLIALCVGFLQLGSASAANKKANNFDRASLTTTIDRVINQNLKSEEVAASPKSSDAEFLRRAYLDLVGIIPTADEAKSFLDSKESDKRAKLIDKLLADPRFGKNMADLWQRRLLSLTSDVRRLNREPLIKWLSEEFNKNTPWNEFVTSIVTATGEQNKNGAVTFFLGNSSIDSVTDTVTRQFLGVQLQCAQCHDHPFTEWTQNQYWGMAMFFRKVAIDNVNRAARDGASPGVTEVSLSNDRATRAKNKGKRIMRLPISAKKVNPRFVETKEDAKVKAAEPYRPILAKWLTSAENPYFAKAMVNRTWQHFFGRGLINPVDDIQPGVESSHPEIMTTLTEGFVASGFDVKELIRAIMNSEAYQRTSKPVEGNAEADAEMYSRMLVKVINPGQLYDSLQSVINQGRGAANAKLTPAQKRRQQQLKQQQRRRGGGGAREQFISFFKYDPYTNPKEYTAGIPQVLRLMNSREFNNFGLINVLVREKKSDAQVIETLYLSTLSRRPTEQEKKFLISKIDKSDVRGSYNDILWALLNCSEFTLNH